MEYEAKRPVYLSATDFLKLELLLMDTRPGMKPDALVAELVNRWLAVETERLALRQSGHATRGVQWKKIFLPDGTCLRTSYCNMIAFAKVVGDHVVADDGGIVTPSQFANRHAKGRNAWRFVWVRFPGEDYWIRADNCRLHTDDILRKQSKKV